MHEETPTLLHALAAINAKAEVFCMQPLISVFCRISMHIRTRQPTDSGLLLATRALAHTLDTRLTVELFCATVQQKLIGFHDHEQRMTSQHFVQSSHKA